jgi:hypothetical protein
VLKDDLPECEAVKAVLMMMHEYRASASFQLEACRFLSVSVFNHDRNRIIVAAEGAVELALAAMKRFPSDLKLQEACCVALTNLAHNCGKLDGREYGTSLRLLPANRRRDAAQRRTEGAF